LLLSAYFLFIHYLRDAEMETLMVEYQISSIPFTPMMLNDLPTRAWTPDINDINNRRDIREWRTMSIDPIGCEDIDDALSVVQLPDGNKLRIGIHIADVSYFIRKGSLLDTEAKSRATSVYFVDRRIDMLPEVCFNSINIYIYIYIEKYKYIKLLYT
jgi:exoribonuclease R